MSDYRIHTLNTHYIAVPVTDDEDGYTYWDIHPNVTDWSSGEPVASASTLADARRAATSLLREDRMYGALLRFGQ